MLIRWSDLRKIPVYTRSGAYLGRITGMEIETESHLARAYFVRKAFLADTLSINREQIVSITSERVTVDDGLVKEAAAEKKKVLIQEEISPVSMSKT